MIQPAQIRSILDRKGSKKDKVSDLLALLGKAEQDFMYVILNQLKLQGNKWLELPKGLQIEHRDTTAHEEAEI